MLRIAAVESNELLFSPVRDQTLFLTSATSPFRGVLESLAKDVRILSWIPHPDLLMREEELLMHKETTALLHQEKIAAIWLNDWSSPALEKWAKQNKFILLCNAFRDQERFENKISFDTFARKHALSVPDGCTVRTKKEAVESGLFPGVLQKPESFGSMGTFFLPNAEALDTLESHFDGNPLLLRRFMKGLPVGITLLLGPTRSLVSALRVQLSWIDSASHNTYYGVQWIPRSALPARTMTALDAMMRRTIDAFRSEGFHGLLSFDWLLTDDNAYLIECNPRQSGSTLQLTAHPELLHGCDYPAECLRIFRNGDPSIDAPTIPDTAFEGTSIDLDSLTIEDVSSMTVPPSGFYALQSDGVRPMEMRMQPLNPSTMFLWTQPADAEGHYRGFAFADLPLAGLKDLRCALHPQGQALLKTLAQLFQPSS